MEAPTQETRLHVLETAAQALDERVTAHGREIDELSQAVTEIRVSDRHRDEALRRIEDNLAKHGGKLDALLLKPASRWDQLVWVVIAAVVGWLLSRAGIG